MESDNEPTDDKRSNTMQLTTNDIKSKAVVKYDIMDQPFRFLQLQVNTNLNKPPANWLRSSSRLEQYIGLASQPKDNSYFSSFTMANNYPDMVGEVDVITDSENIKKLMKIPYSKSDVSMMVHRVGKTLLLDEFDVHQHLLRKQKDDWQWLRKFYFETVAESMKNEKRFLRKNKSRDHLQNQNMFSKFLYYSLGDESLEEDIEALELDDEEDVLSGPEKTEYQRTLLWTFEDIQMMIGTDLPIFGGGTHPCVSLRLRDMRKPISVLTGLDYWLDNLMCNVPELAMCFHLSGIVQNYELINTEDIPNMENSKFSPRVIRDLAQNILSFLKSNATKEGHTYWLFKGHNDDIVKLYDLTTLCSEMKENKNENPFTVPVGMLLYRVAMNVWASCGRKKSGTVRTLLKNALLLLDKEQHSQVVTSANFLLADVYVKDDIYEQTLTDESESESEADETEDAERECSEDEKPETSVNVRTLCHSDMVQSSKGDVVPYPPITSDIEERCREALKHLTEAICCLDEDVKRLSEKPPEEDCPRACKSEAIPLRYEPLKKTKETTESVEPEPTTKPSTPHPLVLAQSNHTPTHSWHHTSKVLLLHKAIHVYYWLADIKVKSLKFGRALRLVKIALLCYARGEESRSILSALLSLAGDAHVMIARENKCVEVHKEEYGYLSEQDEIILNSTRKDLKEVNSAHHLIGDFTCNNEQNLARGCQSYEATLDLFSTTEEDMSRREYVVKRYGNVSNELGVYYMNKAAILAQESDCPDQAKLKDIWSQSFTCFQSGIQAFESINDVLNIALLYSNQGKLMRVCAQSSSLYSDGKRHEFSGQEKMYFTKAIDYYQDSLRVLHSRDKSQPEIWDSITWDLSSTYFTMATLMQDYAPLSVHSQEQVEKDVTDLMLKALKHCDVDTPTAKQTSYQYRAATIHYRLASLYHNSFRNQSNDQKKKHLKTLAELHYGKASKLYEILESPCELLRVQLEKVAMSEFILNSQTSTNSKLKTLQSALLYLFLCKKPLEMLQGQPEDVSSYVDELKNLLTILESRLQFVLLHLVKVNSSVKKSKTSEAHLTNYKKMYAMTLKKMPAVTSEACESQTPKLCSHLSQVIDDLKDIYQIIDPGYRP